MLRAAGRQAVSAARMAVGPLALTGFFLPWAHGPGVLAASAFSGYKLVGFTGALQQLDLTPAQGAVLWTVRLLILGVAVAATWQTLLAPAHRWHVAYVVSGWYLTVTAALALGAGAVRTGVARPASGLALWVVAAALFAAGELVPRVARRASPRRPLPSSASSTPAESRQSDH